MLPRVKRILTVYSVKGESPYRGILMPLKYGGIRTIHICLPLCAITKKLALHPSASIRRESHEETFFYFVSLRIGAYSLDIFAIWWEFFLRRQRYNSNRITDTGHFITFDVMDYDHLWLFVRFFFFFFFPRLFCLLKF